MPICGRSSDWTTWTFCVAGRRRAFQEGSSLSTPNSNHKTGMWNLLTWPVFQFSHFSRCSHFINLVIFVSVLLTGSSFTLVSMLCDRSSIHQRHCCRSSRPWNSQPRQGTSGKSRLRSTVSSIVRSSLLHSLKKTHHPNAPNVFDRTQGETATAEEPRAGAWAMPSDAEHHN